MAWSAEQRRNANIIANVGRSLGASQRDIQIALMAAIVESGLRNLSYGDRDSVGLFQQRDAWGSFKERTDPARSARMFFLGGHAGQRGLFDIRDRTNMSLGRAAQAVQVSAFPDRYDQHKAEAASLLYGVDAEDFESPPTNRTIGRVASPHAFTDTRRPGPIQPSYRQVDEAGGLTAEDALDELSFDGASATPGLGELSFDNAGPMGSPQAGQTSGVGNKNPMSDGHLPSLEDLFDGAGGGGGSFDYGDMPDIDLGSAVEGWRRRVVRDAQKMLGTPYVWGGTSYNGVDCSGLIKLIYGKYGMNMPRISADQARSGQRVRVGDLQPGDLVAWDNSSRNNGADHIAIYIGNGQIIEAPRPGGRVQVNKIYGNAWGVRLNGGGATRAPQPSRGGGGRGAPAPAPAPRRRPKQPQRPRSGGHRAV